MKSIPMQATLFQQQWQTLQEALEARQDAICSEIYRYPHPIPACDQQYNYLLEQRTLVKRELRKLGALQTQHTVGDVSLASLAEFIHNSIFLEDDFLEDDLLMALAQ